MTENGRGAASAAAPAGPRYSATFRVVPDGGRGDGHGELGDVIARCASESGVGAAPGALIIVCVRVCRGCGGLNVILGTRSSGDVILEKDGDVIFECDGNVIFEGEGT